MVSLHNSFLNTRGSLYLRLEGLLSSGEMKLSVTQDITLSKIRLSSIYSREETEEEEAGEFVASGVPPVREGEPSAKRWRFWKWELGKLARDGDCGEACRADATRALDRMLCVEGLYASW